MARIYLSLSLSAEFSASIELETLREAFDDCPASDDQDEWETWLERLPAASDGELTELVDLHEAMQNIDLITVEDAMIETVGRNGRRK